MGGSSTLTITPMRRRHLPGVLAIEGQVYPKPWSQRLFEDELERRGRAYVVARRGEQVVGYAGVLMIADDGHIATVAVDPAAQRAGVGRSLLRELVTQALALGANQLTLEVRVSNDGAQALYREFGFAPVGARKAYYADNGEDALVMWAYGLRDDGYRARLAAIDDRSAAVERIGFDERPPSAHPAAHPALASREAP
ncbi:MAG: ribosomal protein S18-alanine N-acetyltransferase [Acidimicrobiales bacterium]